MTGRFARARSRWAVLLVLLLPLACEDGDSTSNHESGCVADTCAALGALCGALPDGCGGTLECGGCPEGQTCGGGGVANACGAPGGGGCVPTNCPQLGAACGPLPDGCGGTLDCGGCPEGQTCGGGGVANACGVPRGGCVPATCAQLGAQCGDLPDGCGGTLACGDCPDGQICGGGGVANACGAPAPADGATRWALALGGSGDEYVAGLGVRDDGVIVALTLIGVSRPTSYRMYPDALGLVWISPDGRVLRDRTYPVGGRVAAHRPYGFAVSPLGEIFLELYPACIPQGCPDLGAGPIVSDSLVKLSPDGDPSWSVPYSGYGALAADRSGGVAGATEPLPPTAVVKFSGDGELEWRWSHTWAVRSSIDFDDEGNAFIGQALRVFKLDESGAQSWVGVLSEEAVANAYEGVGVYGVRDVEVTDAGTVVAAGVYLQAIDAGGHLLSLSDEGREGVFLAAFSGDDGSLLWARSAGSAGPLSPPWGETAVDVAVGGDGSIALLVATDGCNTRIERWTVTGDRLWDRTVGAPCATDSALFPWAFEWAPGAHLILGGELEGSVDFGAGPVEGGGGLNGFVVDVAP